MVQPTTDPKALLRKLRQRDKTIANLREEISDLKAHWQNAESRANRSEAVIEAFKRAIEEISEYGL